MLLAVTCIGVDRPGIVAGVAKVLFDLGCNLEDASSTILRGHFAMMLIVNAPKGVGPTDLEERLQEVATGLGLVVTVRPLEPASGEVRPATHMISVYGADRPGIVYQVAEFLSRIGANITDLTSRVIGSPDKPVYALMIEAVLPDDSVEPRIDALRNELDVEVSVHRLDTEVL